MYTVFVDRLHILDQQMLDPVWAGRDAWVGYFRSGRVKLFHELNHTTARDNQPRQTHVRDDTRVRCFLQ
jgi:hypothetical protein